MYSGANPPWRETDTLLVDNKKQKGCDMTGNKAMTYDSVQLSIPSVVTHETAK